MNTNLAVLVSSCDKYADLWQPFYQLFFKYWSDCPYPIYHCADTQKFEHLRVQSLTQTSAPTTRLTWAGLMLEILPQIEQRYILFLLDDYFLCRKVHTADVAHYFEAMLSLQASYLRLTPNPPPNLPTEVPHVGAIANDVLYRGSLQVAIWDKEELLRVLRPTDTQWSFEDDVPARARQDKYAYLSLDLDAKSYSWGHRYYQAYYPILHENVCHSGHWDKRALAFIRREGISIDTSRRQMEKRWWRIKNYYYFRYAPWLDHALDFIQHRIVRAFFPHWM